MSRRRRPSDLPQRQQLIAFIADETQRPLSADELAENFQIKAERRAAFNRLLDEMVSRGEILKTRQGRFAAPGKVDLLPGRIQGTRRGDSWFIPEEHDGEDLRVAVEHLKGAMHGDRVLVRRLQGRAGEVVRIVQRSRDTIVGRIECVGGAWFVRPQDGRDAHDIIIPDTARLEAADGELVVCHVEVFGDARRGPVGKVIERLGGLRQPGVDVLAIVRKHNLPEAFPEDVLAEAERVPLEVTQKDIRGRVDLRDLQTFTIDSDDSKDLDDAVSLQATEEGWRLGVHIADVGHYVREGTPLDREAFRRGTSVYLVDRVIPMLPERLSNGICSLNPREDRLALSVFVDFDTAGRRIRHQVQESVIRTAARLSYSGVNRTLDGDPPDDAYQELMPVLFGMTRLKDILGRRRRDRGAIDFDTTEYKVKLNDEGRPLAIEQRGRTASDQLIEEFMLQANEVVAEIASRQNLPFLFRVHEEPDPEKLEGLRGFLGRLGYHLPQSGKKLHPRMLQDILARAAQRPERDLVSAVVLRSMARARYDTQSIGHFGLAAPLYTHFTSPIRRYPDLVIHRILKEYLRKRPIKDERREDLVARLPEIARVSSERERLADEAERESVDLKKVEFMQDKVGEEFDGIVTGVVPFGVFVEVSLGVEGLLRVSSLTDDYYHFDEKLFQLQGERTKRLFRLADRVRVRVERVDTEHGEIDLSLADVQPPLAAPAAVAVAGGDVEPAQDAEPPQAKVEKKSRRNYNRRRRSSRKAKDRAKDGAAKDGAKEPVGETP
ncbi:MAG: ribonuclease R [Thermaerobacter sp.]|nr:ribonuclease R [Thermaerobacter sp.]